MNELIGKFEGGVYFSPCPPTHCVTHLVSGVTGGCYWGGVTGGAGAQGSLPARAAFWKVLCVAGGILGRVMWSP